MKESSHIVDFSNMQQFHNSPLIKLETHLSSTQVIFSMVLKGGAFCTDSLSHTHGYLKKYLPAVLETKCINPKNLPFSEEVKNTQIAHLFEHILLENLCAAKIKSGASEAHFRGWTTWNWHDHPIGSYHIEIDINTHDHYLLPECVKKSLQLTEAILLEKPTQTGNLFC